MSEGRIAAIVVKTEHKGALKETNSAPIEASGLAGNVPTAGHRRVTFISSEQWDETTSELGVDLPWHTRRANVLLEGLRAPDLLGKVLAIGEIRIQVNGETEPCGRMDEIYPGLQKVLEPDCRGGVYGSVLAGGVLNVGDTVRVSEQSKRS